MDALDGGGSSGAGAVGEAAVQAAFAEAADGRRHGSMRGLAYLARRVHALGGGHAAAPGADVAAAREAVLQLLEQRVGPSGESTLLELMANPDYTCRILVHGGTDLHFEAVQVNAHARQAQTFRHPAAWTASRVATTDLDRVFRHVRLWPRPPRPVAEAMLGVVEEQLQSIHRSVTPDGRALMQAGYGAWRDGAVYALSPEQTALALLLLDVVVQHHGDSSLEALEAALRSARQAEAAAMLRDETHMREALTRFLQRAPALYRDTPPLPHHPQPRGAPAWARGLSKATSLYVAIRDAVHSFREVTSTGCVAACWASVSALASAGPTLWHPLNEAPLVTPADDATRSVAVTQPSRTGSLARLGWLALHATGLAAQPPDLWRRPALLHAPTSPRRVVITVFRAPRDRLASLLSLLCSERARWTPAWREALRLPSGSPAALAPALCALLEAGGARARLVRAAPIFIPFATYYHAATHVVPWSETSDALRHRLVTLGVVGPRAPRVPRSHVSPGDAEPAAPAALERLLRLLWPEDERLGRDDPDEKFV